MLNHLGHVAIEAIISKGAVTAPKVKVFAIQRRHTGTGGGPKHARRHRQADTQTDMDTDRKQFECALFVCMRRQMHGRKNTNTRDADKTHKLKALTGTH